jgi:hypothetical protein
MSRRPLALQRISRRGLISSAVLAGVLSASGVAVQARERRGVLRLGLSGSLPGWDPRAGRGSLARVALSGAVYETLTEITAAGELTGELAESWEPGEGAAVWTVTLRGGTAFHDGSPVTAGDVIASLALHRDGSPAAPILRAVQDMRALTPRQIRFRLDAPDANFRPTAEDALVAFDLVLPVTHRLAGLSDSLTVGRPSADTALQTRLNGASASSGPAAESRWSASCPSQRTPSPALELGVQRFDLSTSSPSEKITSFFVGSSPRLPPADRRFRALGRIAAVDADAGPARQPVGRVLQEAFGAVGVGQDDAQVALVLLLPVGQHR